MERLAGTLTQICSSTRRSHSETGLNLPESSLFRPLLLILIPMIGVGCITLTDSNVNPPRTGKLLSRPNSDCDLVNASSKSNENRRIRHLKSQTNSGGANL